MTPIQSEQMNTSSTVTNHSAVPDLAKNAVFTLSQQMNPDTPAVQGYDFNQIFDFDNLMKSYKYMGFQASALADAIDEINRMRNWRLSDEPIAEDEPEEFRDPEVRKSTKCKIFLAYTSNLVSAGTREILRYLAQHRMVDVIVATAGGIEEDFVKCLAPTFMGDFALRGAELRQKGLNRIGNLIVPNDNYCKFEDWLMPILDQMLLEQKETGKIWAPSTMINRLGKEINDPSSIYYWAWKNDIPVFSPALTDGSLGDMIYFHSFRNPGLVLDIAQDIRAINSQAVFAQKTGVIILGGGVVKHHTLNANLMRNGTDYAVFINTSSEFDGSDSGARPDEAISWGKIKLGAKPVKVYSEVSLVLPLIVSQTFAKEHQKQQDQQEN